MVKEIQGIKELDNKLEVYKETEPEVVFEWHDQETYARGWIVINSLKNGAAGGGTRMRRGLTKDEVVALAKVMEVKFAVCGPPIGGAKSGIDFDPKDPRRDEVLQRWYKAVIPVLKAYYGTGGDLNVDELRDVVPITESLGLWHPQEGIVNGYLRPSDGEKVNILGQLRHGVSKIVTNKNFVPNSEKEYAVADMATGYGVAESIRHFYKIFKNEDLTGKRVIIQGWGNVASAAGYYLAKSGAVIVGIIDKDGGIISSDGLDPEKVTELFLNKKNNTLTCDKEDFETSNNKIWDVACDIFVPGAASRLVTKDQVERMMSQGLEVISCGANVPFSDDTVFFGETARYLDSKITVIPDFVANCGMARVFAYLMQKNVELSDESIFGDISQVIERFLEWLHREDSSTLFLSTRSLIKALEVIEK
jgi:glutamate dehydrogenase/leucine dehydrogenase